MTPQAVPEVPDRPNLRLEARAYGLMTTRRALTQALAGLSVDQLWAPIAESGRSMGAIARSAWEQEAFWLWPPEIPPPQLDQSPALEGLLYALIRHRAVTEELLMGCSDDDLDRIYVSRARGGAKDGADHEPTTLGAILESMMRDELFAAAEAATLRRLIDPSWAGNREACDNAAEAVALSRQAG